MTRSSGIDIPLHVVRHPADTHASARRREPVTFGVPLPQGVFAESQRWRILGDSGEVLPVQARPLDRWPDGSIRWLLVDSQVDVPASGTTRLHLAAVELEYDAAAVGAPNLLLDDAPEGVVVNTGPVLFGFRPGASSLFDRLETSGPPVVDPHAGVVELVDPSGGLHRATVTRVSVQDRGPLRVRIALDLAVPNGPLNELMLHALVDLHAGLPSVRIGLRVRNPRRAHHPGGFWDLGDPGSILMKDVSLKLALPSSSPARAVEASVDGGVTWSSCAVPFELYQDSSGGENWKSTAHLNRDRRVPNRFRGYRIRSGGDEESGLRATPVLELPDAAGGLAIAMPHFWQNFPKVLEADDRSLTLRFFPHQYDDLHEIQGGEQKTHVCFVSFGRDPVADSPLEWCCAPILVCPEPSWYLSAAAVPWLSADDPSHAELVRTAVDGPDTFARKREIVDEYGWRHFGDIYADHEAVRQPGSTPLVSHYNNQYDPIAGFLYQFFRTGDARWWIMAGELAAHVVDIDVYHTDGDKWAYNHGMFWHTYHYGDAHTSSHRTYPQAARGITHGGGPSPDHNYTTGLMLHYLLTGDEGSRQTVAELAQFVIDADDGAKTVMRWLSRTPTGLATASGSYAYHGPGRGPANALNALLDGYRLTAEAKFIEKAEEIMRRVVHPSEDIARLRLDDPENRWFYLMFLQSLGKYLGRKAELGRLDTMYAYGRASLLHYARWMVDHEYPYLERPEKLEFPTETWAAHEVRKSDIFGFAALHATGEERERFLERARFFFLNAVQTLEGMPTRTLARPVIVLLSSGLLLPWLDAHPRATAPPPAESTPSFRPPVRFVPQKEIAKRRALLLAAAGGASAVVTLVTLVWWLAR